MRTIKFRAWDKKKKEMLAWKKVSVMTVGRLGASGTPWEFMQYTGLQDKQGKEIYEGDLCHFLRKDYTSFDNDLERKFAVIWDDRQGHWGAVDSQIPLARFEQENLEVIGNIYENKDLLK